MEQMKRNKILSVILSLALVLGMIPGMSLTAYAIPEPVSYVYYTVSDTTATKHTDGSQTSYTVVTDQTAWSDGWYVVNSDITIADRITVSGTVHLILCDGKTLTASKGITVNDGNTLHIYAQSTGDNAGKLTAIGAPTCAGIGSSDKNNSGNIYIHGGAISASSESTGAGIGGGRKGAGTVTVFGGDIIATGGSSDIEMYNENKVDGGGAGIGNGAFQVNGGSVTILGGTITANGGKWAAGIGGGSRQQSFGTITIKNATVEATGNKSGAGIGGGSTNKSLGDILIENSTIIATGGEDGAGIGGGSHSETNGGGDGANVTIINSNVTATGNGRAVGIGHGTTGSDGTITFSLDEGLGILVSTDNSTWSVYDGSTRTQYMKTGEIPQDTAIVTKAPIAKNLTYTGSAQELVTAGEAKGGTMYYAVTENENAPEAAKFTTSIPTGTSAGTYYVWYKAKGDENLKDGEAANLRVTIGKVDQNKPEGITATQVSDATAKDGTITGLNDTMEYSVDNGKTWTAVPKGSTKIENLSAGDILIRVAGTKDKNPSEAVKLTVDVKKTETPEPSTAETPEPSTAETPATRELAINAGFKVTQTGSKIKIAWGKVAGADNYEVYVAYCGNKFTKKATKTTKNNSVTITKVNGKKLNLKKNFKVKVVATKDGKKFANTIAGHVVGRKNSKYTNAKNIKLITKEISVEKGKTAKVQAKTVLVDKKKKQLTNAHATEFRYASSDKSIATVSKKGVVTGKSAGTCTVYVYSRNGLAKTVKVTVK